MQFAAFLSGKIALKCYVNFRNSSPDVGTNTGSNHFYQL